MRMALLSIDQQMSASHRDHHAGRLLGVVEKAIGKYLSFYRDGLIQQLGLPFKVAITLTHDF